MFELSIVLFRFYVLLKRTINKVNWTLCPAWPPNKKINVCCHCSFSNACFLNTWCKKTAFSKDTWMLKCLDALMPKRWLTGRRDNWLLYQVLKFSDNQKNQRMKKSICEIECSEQKQDIENVKYWDWTVKISGNTKTPSWRKVGTARDDVLQWGAEQNGFHD